jgi:glucose 1-dehydrogenase
MSPVTLSLSQENAGGAMRLAGKVALVTGASSGIGKATAWALAEAGADVALNYYSLPESAEELAGRIRGLGRKALLCPVDVADQAAVEGMVGRVAAELGRLDVFVSCAYFSEREFFHTADMSGFRRTLDVTMWGAFYGLRACARVMIDQGQGGNMVLISSGHAVNAIPTCMAYNMAKAAIDQMGRTAALELARHRIRVNIVYPGWTDTEGERKYYSEEVMARTGERLPWGRLGRPEEVARGILFLVDPDSDYITGSILQIDGGIHLPWWSKRGTGEL